MNSLSQIRDHLLATCGATEMSLVSTRLTLDLGYGVKTPPTQLDRDPVAVRKVKITLHAMGYDVR